MMLKPFLRLTKLVLLSRCRTSKKYRQSEVFGDLGIKSGMEFCCLLITFQLWGLETCVWSWLGRYVLLAITMHGNVAKEYTEDRTWNT